MSTCGATSTLRAAAAEARNPDRQRADRVMKLVPYQAYGARERNAPHMLWEVGEDTSTSDCASSERSAQTLRWSVFVTSTLNSSANARNRARSPSVTITICARSPSAALTFRDMDSSHVSGSERPDRPR